MPFLSPYLWNTDAVSEFNFMLSIQKVKKNKDCWIPVNLLHMFIKYKILFLISFALLKKQIHILLGYLRPKSLSVLKNFNHLCYEYIIINEHLIFITLTFLMNYNFTVCINELIAYLVNVKDVITMQCLVWAAIYAYLGGYLEHKFILLICFYQIH